MQGCAGIWRGAKAWFVLQGLAVTLIFLSGLPAAATAAPQPATPLEASSGVPGSGRSWEVVTSEEPVSAFLERSAPTGFLAPSGNRIFYMTLGKLPDAPMQENITLTAFATRGTSGWVNATLPGFENSNLFADTVNNDLSEGILRGYGSGGERSLFRFGLEGSSAALAATAGGSEMYLVGASDDLGRVYFESAAHLVPGDAGRTSGRSIYESSDSGIRLVDVSSGGNLISSCGSESVAVGEMPNRTVSTDGRRIYFTTDPGCTDPKRVYFAQVGSPAVDVSASRCDLADCGPEADVEFAAATPSGFSAFLLTTQRLTDEDTDSRISLYRYDVDTGALTLLTPSSAELTSIRGVQAAEDGSSVYFKAEVEGEAGQHLFEVDSAGLHRLPVTLRFGAFIERLQMSSDGSIVAFETTAALLPSDTDSTADIYLYDDRSRTLTLLSSGAGQRPATFTVENESMPLYEPPDGPYLGGYYNIPYRAISADGTRVVFTTAEPLLPQDHNEADDVYEATPSGLDLVSSGAAGSEGSFFDGMTPDGSTVFFTTGDTLLPHDRDGGARDIYAARIGGGFPEPVPPAACDACRNAVPPPGPRPTASSAVRATRIRVGRIGAAARRRMAASGWIVMLLEAPASGRLRAAAKARIGRRSRIVAKARVRVRRPGPLRLRMRLSRPARARLAAGRKLRLRLRLREGRGVPPRSLWLVLGGRRR